MFILFNLSHTICKAIIVEGYIKPFFTNQVSCVNTMVLKVIARDCITCVAQNQIKIDLCKRLTLGDARQKWNSKLLFHCT